MLYRLLYLLKYYFYFLFIIISIVNNIKNMIFIILHVPFPFIPLRLWSKSRYKCFEAFDEPIRRKNFIN